MYSLINVLNKIQLPIILAKIENKSLYFILDTGSTCSLIDCNVVEYFRDIVEPVGEYNILGIEGTKHKVDVVILSFTFEGQEYKPKFCTKPLTDAFTSIKKESGMQIHGLLGTDFLLENKWIIDFNKYQIYD